MKYRALRKRTAQVLEVSHQSDRLGRVVDFFLIGLILSNVVAIVLESVPALHGVYHREFWNFEVFSVSIFTVEYLLRIWSSVELPSAPDHAPIIGRLRYVISPTALIDLLAILPFFLGIFATIDLRFLRVIRLLRVFKLSRYSPAMNVLLSVLREEAGSFAAAFFVLFTMLVMTSSGIYLIEHKVQPQAFGSIPDAMWWAMATLTTVGYGDVTPVTAVGKFFGGIVTIIGMGMVALPAGILASGFASQMRRRRDEYAKVVSNVLEDGHITQEERWQLEYLRKELDINEEDAKLLLDKIARKNLKVAHAGVCPHCGQPFQNAPPNVPPQPQ